VGEVAGGAEEREQRQAAATTPVTSGLRQGARCGAIRHGEVERERAREAAGRRGGNNREARMRTRELRARVAARVGGRLTVGVGVFSRLRWAASSFAGLTCLASWPCHVPGVRPRHNLPTGLHARPRWPGFVLAHLHRPECPDIPVVDSFFI
jgi:hypothetical protein